MVGDDVIQMLRYFTSRDDARRFYLLGMRFKLDLVMGRAKDRWFVLGIAPADDKEVLRNYRMWFFPWASRCIPTLNPAARSGGLAQEATPTASPPVPPALPFFEGV